MRLCCLILGVCIVVFLTGKANPVLAFNRQNLHLWQLISAHFVHFDFRHLTSNMIALILMWYLFPLSVKDLLMGFVLATSIIGFYLLFSKVQFYVGFSAILYIFPGQFTHKHIQNKYYGKALFILSIFVIYSFLSFSKINISDEIVWKPSIIAHYFGFVAGFLNSWQVSNTGTKRSS